MINPQNDKTVQAQRLLEILYRGMRGQDLSTQRLAQQMGVDKKTITRDKNAIRQFLADNHALVGDADLRREGNVHKLYLGDFLLDQELFVIIKMILGTRALSHADMELLVKKLQDVTTGGHEAVLQSLLASELAHYEPIGHANESIITTIWQLIRSIEAEQEIAITYHGRDDTLDANPRNKRIRPLAVLFSEHYFYLLAHPVGEAWENYRRFRVDRILGITIPRKQPESSSLPRLSDGELRNKNPYMTWGELVTVKFWYNAPSVQAILDRLPTARVVEQKNGSTLIEAQGYGEGLRYVLLSFGRLVQVTEPASFVAQMQSEIAAMHQHYSTNPNPLQTQNQEEHHD